MPAKQKEIKLTEAPRAETGAPSALRWIEEQEARARTDYDLRVLELNTLIKRQQAATAADDGTDWGALIAVAENNLSFARENSERWLKSLREFDKAVDIASRDATEKIPRSAVESFVKMFAIYARQGIENLANRFADTILECREKQEVHKRTYELFHECSLAAIDSAIRESHLPNYAKDAIEGVL